MQALRGSASGSSLVSTTMPEPTRPQESAAERKQRLERVLTDLDRAGRGTFLDLCELVELYARRVQGMIKWNHPRVLVHIKHVPRAKKGKA